jgi:DNA-binding MarR family transcriptional regulator
MEETRWLSEPEQAVWRAYLEATQRLWEQLARELDEAGDLPLAEYEVLVRLSEAPGRRMRMSELADALSHSRSRLTHTVARMESRGLVTRIPCDDDGRGVLAGVTEDGLAALRDHADVHVTGVREHLFDRMEPDEVEVLGRVLTRVAAHLREVRGATGDRRARLGA